MSSTYIHGERKKERKKKKKRTDTRNLTRRIKKRKRKRQKPFHEQARACSLLIVIIDENICTKKKLLLMIESIRLSRSFCLHVLIDRYTKITSSIENYLFFSLSLSSYIDLQSNHNSIVCMSRKSNCRILHPFMTVVVPIKAFFSPTTTTSDPERN